MARHLIKVNNQNSLLNGLDSGYIENPYVALVSGATAPDYNGSSATPFEQQYFTIAPANGGMAYVTCPSGLYYSTNRGESWSSADYGFFLMNNQVAWLKGTSVSYSNSNKFSVASGSIMIYGNIMSLQFGDSFSGVTDLSSLTFHSLFKDSTATIDASNLVLPATTIPQNAYRSMFQNCTGLTNAPSVLPATTLGASCYNSMFSGCTSLKNTPVISATTLVNNCYQSMFENCTSLTTVPFDYLPATTLANGCYYTMFKGCTSLNSSVYELPATTLATECYRGMFQGCISLTTAPVLSAATLAGKCYRDMFNGCSSLNYIKCLATDISASNCTYNWVTNVAQTGTFVKNANMSSWTTGSAGIPEGWTVEDSE